MDFLAVASFLVIFFIFTFITMYLTRGSSQSGGRKSGMLKGVNNNMLVGLFAVFVGLWLLFYMVPAVFASLFFTTLGNIIIILSIILVGMKNMVLGGLVALGLFLLYRYSHMIAREGMKTSEKKEEPEKRGVNP